MAKADEKSVDLREALRQKQIALEQLESARAELEKSQYLRSAVLDNVFDAILAYDEKGRRTLCNREARELLGTDLIDIPVKDWPESIGLFDAATEKRLEFDDMPVAKALMGETLREVTLKIRRADDEDVLVHANARPMHNKDGKLIGCVTSFRDITEERKAQEQLIQAQRLDSLGKLTGGIAHDFNNLLSTMLGSLQLLGRRVAEDERAKKYVEMCLRAAKNGQSLTSHLLTFSRRQRLEPSAIQLSSFFTELEPLLRTSIEATIQIGIKPIDEDLIAFCDAAQLDAALVNLVVNSRDAIADAENGAITIQARELTVEAGRSDSSESIGPGNYVEISVSDNGSGMPKHIQQRALDPFFSTKGASGTGLGLSMVYGFVAQSGGHVHIYSEAGVGTSVKLFLPRADRAAPDDVAREHHDTAEDPRGQGELVLVVEDENDLRDVAAGLLSDLGYNVVLANSGPEALNILKKDGSIDLLFTDIVMPGGMTGVQLYDAALKLRPDLPVLYTSGYAHSVVEEIETISDKLLSKPYVQSTLAKMVRAALEHRI